MLTMMMSIAHRISGVALYAGAAAAGGLSARRSRSGRDVFRVSWIVNGFFGHVIVLVFSWALFHHLLGGVRHALWDRGLFMDPKGRELLAQGDARAAESR